MNTSEIAAYKAERKIRVDKNQKWASTPAEHFELLKSIFRNYLETEIGYDREDIKWFTDVFEAYISPDNIYNYNCRTCKEIYLGIINGDLQKIANYVKI